MSWMHQNFDPKRHTLYRPKNPEKYAGNPSNIVSRSSYETKFYRWLDNNTNVISWVTEPFGIPYTDPTSFKQRKYYPDVLFKCKTIDNSSEVFLVEVKPMKECRPPRKNKNKKTMIRESEVWAKNLAKWAAAKRYCSIKGWKFKLITEKELEI